MPTSTTPSGGSHFAGALAARAAIEMALPMIEVAINDPAVCGGGFLWIVVMDPARSTLDSRFEEALVAEHGIGDEARWGADYRAFARAKARAAWRCMAGGDRLQADLVHQLQAGDSLLRGAVVLDGIVVAVSGAEPWFDEAFANCVAGNLRAIAQQAHAAERAAGGLAAGVPR